MIPTRVLEVQPGISIEYRLAGPYYAPAIVFLHELGTNLHQFDIQQLLLSQKYQILLVSFRGHGLSQITLSQQPEHFSINQLATDILYVMKTLKIQKAHFIGNGLGFFTCLEIFNLTPQSVHSLIAFGSFSAQQENLKPYHYQNVVHNIKKLKRAPGKKAIHKQLNTMLRNASHQAILYLSQHVNHFNSSQILQNAGSVPKLFIQCGVESKPLHQFPDQVRTPSLARSSQIVTMYNTTHFANMDNPSQFNRIITDFIQTLQPVHMTRERPIHPGGVFSNLKPVVKTSNNEVNLI